MEDKELVKKVREIAKEFPENDMKRALLLGITDRFIGVKVNSILISVIQNKIDELDKIIPSSRGEEFLIFDAKKDVLQELLELKE